MELKTIRYEVSDGIATVMLSRPKRRNAWTGRMHTEYRWALAEADKDRAVRVIVVTGDPEGNAFCAGADLGALEGHSEKGRYDAGISDDIAKPGFGVAPEFDATFAYHFGLTKPVIAAINGAAAGVGLVLAAFADLRFCVPGAKFTAAHGRFNFPAEFGLSWVLPRLVGVTHANDILLSSRVFTSEEAMEMGFLNKLVPPAELMPHVMAYARAMADGVSPGSLRETKRQIYTDLHRDAASAVVAAERLLEEMVRHPDYKEGVKAWMEKRRAEWQG
ncbi:enoyl-CoA hydratase-related protein [Parvibaculum sp.]|uniref:enoyl-CoA hydratase-related protein n=1 Tax=Parvibaculum sp. TaxID=2024848 RepID=UPI001D6CEF04|nr:enoyl-CoA hydratase-related protein [Parvibaculum sp.]MBX3490057.1 enoyl-CoA hydratase/isomerase family protein [Parvibaculum sp.]MCW5725955.1 enoyl-CoA hydratase/isomerase family protein [Parvibaculum sp.]